MGATFTLRTMTAADRALVRAWADADPTGSTDPALDACWPTWWTRVEAGTTSAYVLVADDDDAGFVVVDHPGGEAPTVAVYLTPPLRGSGAGTVALVEAARRHPGVRLGRVHTDEPTE